MNKFEKVSYKQYCEDCGYKFDELIKLSITGKEVELQYEEIKLPKRATKLSAGYDFYIPHNIKLNVGESVKIPTGIRVFLDSGTFLACVPRSGLGFKFRLQLDNTIGIVDADYCESDNEGHIFLKITNDGKEDKTIEIKKGEAFAQGIIIPYRTTVDDDVNEIRNGGLGSTN